MIDFCKASIGNCRVALGWVFSSLDGGSFVNCFDWGVDLNSWWNLGERSSLDFGI